MSSCDIQPRRSARRRETNTAFHRLRPALLMLLLGGILFSGGRGLLHADDVEESADISRSDRDEASDEADDQEQLDQEERERRQRDRARRTPRRSRSQSSSSNRRTRSRKPADTAGVDGQVGFAAFKTFGRDASLGYFELLPYVMADEHMLFGNLRGFADIDGQFGGNLGGGYRFWHEGLDRMFGGSLWYDFDQTSGELFHQVAFNLETRGEKWDARTNLYLPVFDTEQETGNSVINLRYSGDNILFDHRRDSLAAMQGIDVEAGVQLPSRFARRHDIRLYGGVYRFTGDNVPDINGWKSRLQGHLGESVSGSLEFTTDGTWGSTVMLGAAFEFSGGVKKGKSRTPTRSQQMRRFAQRNFNIITDSRTDITSDLTAINPATGLPWSVAHVSSSAGGGGTGNLLSPFDTIADAQAAARDLIFVHADSVFSTPVVLAADEILVGERAEHFFDIVGFGRHLLPRATAGTDSPLLQGVTGDALTLADNVVVAGFTIDGTTGHGVAGSGVDGAILRDIEILSTDGSGFELTGSTGSWLLSRIDISGTTGTALHIDGGTASMVLSGELTNTSGSAVVIENTTSGTLNLRAFDITDTGGDGLLVDSNGAAVDFGDVTSTGSTGNGITLTGNTGNVDFFGTTTVSGAAGNAIDIQNNTGKTGFANLDLETTGQTALFVRDSGEVIVEGGTIDATASGAAVDIEGTEVDVVVRSISADGGAFGIRLVDTPGQFVVFGDGTGTAGSGGLIQNMTTAGIIAENTGTLALQYVDLDNNNVGLQATTATLVVLQSSRVTDSTSFGVDLLDVQGLQVIGSHFTGNGDTGLRAQMQTEDDYDYTIRGSVFEQPAGDGVAISTLAGGEDSELSLLVSLSDFSNTATGTSGVSLDWDGELSSATFAQNDFIGTGGSNTGILLITQSTTETASIGLGGNEFIYTGGADTAIAITTAGQSAILIESNSILFDDPGGIGAAGGTGMNFDLAGPASVSLLNNLIIDNDSSGTGILFTSISGPSTTVAINANDIRLLSTDANVDRGIVFVTVPSAITLSGTLNNRITGATDNFLEPGNVGGSFFINGVLISP